MNTGENFLLSLPNMGDNNFRSAVVYVEKHNGDGAKGWVINKELDSRIAVRLRKSIQLGVVCPIFYGGPVQSNQVYVLHSDDVVIPDATIQLNDNLCMTRDKIMVARLNQQLFPNYWKVVVGCCTWGAGQLESEILGSRTNGHGMWNSIPFDSKMMWETTAKDQWELGLDKSASIMTKNYLNF